MCFFRTTELFSRTARDRTRYLHHQQEMLNGVKSEVHIHTAEMCHPAATLYDTSISFSDSDSFTRVHPLFFTLFLLGITLKLVKTVSDGLAPFRPMKETTSIRSQAGFGPFVLYDVLLWLPLVFNDQVLGLLFASSFSCAFFFDTALKNNG